MATPAIGTATLTSAWGSSSPTFASNTTWRLCAECIRRWKGQT